MLTNHPTSLRWVRARDGMIGGVCQGVAQALDVEVALVRVLWIAAVLLAGTGMLAYIFCWIALPHEDRLARAHERRVLGVCATLSRRGEMEVGLTRLLALGIFALSGGTALIAYLVLYLVLPRDRADA